MSIKDKKILVTGGAGFLGKHLVQKLLERGVPKENIFVPRLQEFDLRERENCQKVVLGKDVVIHLAGVAGGIAFHKEHPAITFYDNLMMGVELMEAARRAHVQKFVTIGSAMEYPEDTPIPFHEENIWLGPTESIHAPYAIAKKMLLVQAQAYRAQYGFNSIHLLLTNMYGPGAMDSSMVIPSLIKRVGEAKKLGQKSVEVWGSGHATRDFIYVEDAARAILLAAERYDKLEPVNVASGWEISVRELAELICRVMDYEGEVKWDMSKPEGQLRRMLDTSRAEREFGFKATTDFEAGLRKTVKYYGH